MEAAQKTSPNLDAIIEEALNIAEMSEELKEQFAEELPLLRKRISAAFNINIRSSEESAMQGVRSFIKKWIDGQRHSILYDCYLDLMKLQNNTPHPRERCISGAGIVGGSAMLEFEKLIEAAIDIGDIVEFKGQQVRVKSITKECRMVLNDGRGKAVARAAGANSVKIVKKGNRNIISNLLETHGYNRFI